MASVALSLLLLATFAAGSQDIVDLVSDPKDADLSMLQGKAVKQDSDSHEDPPTPCAMDDPMAAIAAAQDVDSSKHMGAGTPVDLEALTRKLGPLPDKPDDWLMNTPIETWISYATGAVYGLGGGENMGMSDELIQFYKDFNNKFVAIETIITGALDATDQFVLYRRNDECVVVVSGTDDLHDAGQDINIQKIPACGTVVHAGMYKEALRVNAGFDVKDKAMLNYFTSEKCQKRYTSGHSLGGAVIEFMTVCMSPLKDMELDGFFSFGAPGVSADPIPVDRELTMPTYRLWTSDSRGFDLVPWILEGLHGLGHPKMRSFQLEDMGNGTWVEHVLTPDTPGATEGPTGFTGMPKMTLHMYDVYSKGLEFLYGA